MLEIESLKRPIINSEIEFVIKKKNKNNLPAKKKARAGGLWGKGRSEGDPGRRGQGRGSRGPGAGGILEHSGYSRPRDQMLAD